MDQITKNNWIICAEDLKIDIQIPFYIEINKSEIETILFKNFGNRNGTIVFNSFDKLNRIQDSFNKRYKNYNMAVFDYSLLNYKTDIRKAIIEMLSEWGWTGQEKEKPSWLLENINFDEDEY
ncbi:hypothetical protein HMPREF1221_00002 [Treponema socranskii subsp. paredis ATCC 35535]|nr:hypothetical protein HMPREF1221_00002 [Treponema socranskii subsp. paredis ATCC 35535]